MASMPGRWQLISFDLDGTLVDTACEIAEAANRVLEAHGLARRAPAQITLFVGAGTHELIRRLHALCAQEEPGLAERVPVASLLSAMDRHYLDTTGTAAQPYAGCRESLDRLKRAGLRLACVTNKELRHARRVLEVTALDGFFDLVVGGDTLPYKKPEARVLRHVAQALGASLDGTAHVGDSSIDVAAARNAGVAAWAVPYGYNAGVPVADAKPDRLFASLSAVADHVLAASDARA